MKLKQLQSLLENVEDFSSPQYQLEQYMTPPYIAATMIHSAKGRDDITNCSVLDLGCGTGMLTIASSLAGAGYCLGIDVCSDAIQQAKRNCCDLLNNIEFLITDIRRLRGFQFDTVIMNPPFGTKYNELSVKNGRPASRGSGLDVIFLKRAIETADVVYSLHKSVTRKYLEYTFKDQEFEVISVFNFPIMKRQGKRVCTEIDIPVDFIRLQRI
ncbi:hypothetical protein GJ496_005797 [Pomphorhynchus laevis]|nr:hypothetical protein GJ496_005797 [Pomphorhynchus laevis]